MAPECIFQFIAICGQAAMILFLLYGSYYLKKKDG